MVTKLRREYSTINIIKVAFLISDTNKDYSVLLCSTDLPMFCHSLYVPSCNSLLFLNKLIFAGKITVLRSTEHMEIKILNFELT